MLKVKDLIKQALSADTCTAAANWHKLNTDVEQCCHNEISVVYMHVHKDAHVH